MAKRIKYDEGDIFAVPLRSGSFGIGILTTISNTRTGAVGYFYEPAYAKLPTLESIPRLIPSKAIDICHFGDLGIVKGEWPILGKQEPFLNKEWEVTKFWHHDSISNRYSIRVYEPPDYVYWVSEYEVSEVEIGAIPKDGLYGKEALEIKLTKLLEG